MRDSAQTLRALRLAALVHDIGEAKIPGWESVGDIAADQKTATTETVEQRIGRRIVSELSLPSRLHSDLSAAYEGIVNGAYRELHTFLKGGERLEYLMTAQRVFTLATRQGDEHQRLSIRNASVLTARVIAYDVPKILDRYADRFPNSIGAWLRENRPSIETMMQFSSNAIHADVVEDLHHEPFRQAVAHWERWTVNHP